MRVWKVGIGGLNRVRVGVDKRRMRKCFVFGFILIMVYIVKVKVYRSMRIVNVM